jgi:hypothetical protein
VQFPRSVFQAALGAQESRIVEGLRSPEEIQAFLTNEVRYNFEPDGETAYGPLEVLRRRTAHCFEGAIFAAALMWYRGWDPLLVLLEAPEDFDHNLIIYTREGRLGSVSQSRHPELRGKAPSFGGLRELVLSYYPDYYSDWTHDPNDLTLRGFSEPIDLRRFGSLWVTAVEVWDIYRRYAEGVRFERLFPAAGQERCYLYPEEHLTE